MEKTSQTVQQARISDLEKSLLRNTFKDREDLLLALRNLFLGFELNPSERELVNSFSSPELRKVLRKHFFPELQKDIPLGMNHDLYMTITINSLDEFSVKYEALVQTMGMIELALALLDDPDGVKPDLSLMGSITHANLIARNSYIVTIDQACLKIRMLANGEQETPEQRKERIKKDSMK